MSMETFRRQKGQTIIETAFILTLLLLILLGITEFARAWYMKNSLKNAVRDGARKAVVSVSITPTIDPVDPNDRPYVNCTGACPSGTTIDNTYIKNAVCCVSGIPNRQFNDPQGGTRVSITYTDADGNSSLNAGDTILVSAQTNFRSIVPLLSRYLRDKTITTDASMRYEE